MREPYPNELYHYGVKGMKWGRRKARPVGSGSLHRVGDGLGSGPVGSDSNRQTVGGRPNWDGATAKRKYKNAVQLAFRSNLVFDAGPCFVAKVGEWQGVPRAFVLTNDDGTAIYGLCTTKEKALEEANRLQAKWQEQEKEAKKARRQSKKRGMKVFQGIVDGMQKAVSSGGWETSLDKGAR